MYNIVSSIKGLIGQNESQKEAIKEADLSKVSGIIYVICDCTKYGHIVYTKGIK